MMYRCGCKSIFEYGIEKPKRLLEVLMEVIRTTRYRNGMRGFAKTETDCWRLVKMMEDMMDCNGSGEEM